MDRLYERAIWKYAMWLNINGESTKKINEIVQANVLCMGIHIYRVIFGTMIWSLINEAGASTLIFK